MNWTVRGWFDRWWKIGIAGMLSFCVAIALNASNAAHFKTQAAQVPQVVISTLGDFKTFNPAFNSEFPNIFLYTSEGLISENGETSEIEPALAESWIISDDKKKITFTLRDGLKWSDGHPLTVDDVLFTYRDVYLNEKIPTDFRDLLRIGKDGKFPSIRKVDDRRIEFTTPEPFAPFLRVLGVGILPAHALRESVFTNDADGKPQFLSTWGTGTNPKDLVVNGPYTLESYTPGQRYVFRRNPYYWRKDKQGQQLPHIERLVMQIVESTDTQLLRFRSGDLDMLGELGSLRPEDFSLLKQEERRGNFQIQQGGLRTGTLYVTFNLNTGRRQDGTPLVDPIKSRWFNTKEFRQAVAYAINRDKLINNVFRGLAKPQNSPISVQSPFYLSPEQGLKTYDYNPQRARELLQQAGFQYNSQNQLLDADGNRVRFNLLTNAENKLRVAIGAQVKQDLAAIGIQVDFAPISFGTVIEKMNTSLDWECILLGLTGGIEPNDGFNIWNPEGGSHLFNQGPQPGSPPIVGRRVSDWEREIGNLYIQGAQELDETKRKAIYAKTQQITQENLPFIYLANQMAMAAIRNRVEGVRYTALGLTYWNIAEQKVKPD
ncbi:ABC transporter substrate-binding protein [Leptodesmis sichuanensis]|uniref:ABC transporter substrate-binding protein n=1 Tax=Leptodesmis sichuanensis TaxID=2906798 RepID=UPI001F34C24F|nr:ABC transporter substrate-binding protein [Leptodesmis sichuanensis]UIE35987.1 ABC transporter substrate-binding protein [Leptodesmis sichuanensis A121]